MTFLVERLSEIRKYLDHLRRIGDRVEGPESLESDLSLHNDVLFSLMMLAQLVIDIAGEIGAREALRFDDYTGAVRNLVRVDEFPQPLVDDLARLPGFRNVLLHEYVELDYALAVKALAELESVDAFVEAVRRYVKRTETGGESARD